MSTGRSGASSCTTESVSLGLVVDGGLDDLLDGRCAAGVGQVGLLAIDIEGRCALDLQLVALGLVGVDGIIDLGAVEVGLELIDVQSDLTGETDKILIKRIAAGHPA